jgi:hypothetical protein
MLPRSGHVLGVDIGFSPDRPTGAVCLLSWSPARIDWRLGRFRYRAEERYRVLAQTVNGKPLLAAAFDGPLRGDLAVIDRYRMADRMLTRRLQKRAGKPGPANTPQGRLLNQATNEAARVVLDLGGLAAARHATAIHERALAEAFPSSFMAFMLPDPTPLVRGRAGKSDRFFASLLAQGLVDRYMRHYVPLAEFDNPALVTNHDDRAAFVCALTAMAVAAGDHAAVGDANGWIILPPRALMQAWAFDQLCANALEAGVAAFHY